MIRGLNDLLDIDFVQIICIQFDYLCVSKKILLNRSHLILNDVFKIKFYNEFNAFTYY